MGLDKWVEVDMICIALAVDNAHAELLGGILGPVRHDGIGSGLHGRAGWEVFVIEPF